MVQYPNFQRFPLTTRAIFIRPAYIDALSSRSAAASNNSVFYEVVGFSTLYLVHYSFLCTLTTWDLLYKWTKYVPHHGPRKAEVQALTMAGGGSGISS